MLLQTFKDKEQLLYIFRGWMKMKKSEKEIVNRFLFAHIENAETEEGNRLTHDVMCEILLTLPTKSLVIFKCVCKAWFSMISDPNF